MTENEPKSWGESIRAYESSKNALPWQPKDVDPIVKLDAFERRTLEREVDPILMQYRDPMKEQDFSETLRVKMNNRKPRAQAGQKFNIINHQGPRPKPINMGNQFRGKRDWNLLSHFPEKLHTKAPTEFDQLFQIECSKRKNPQEGLNNNRGRDYSILSNKFNEDDTARRLDDHIRVQDHLRKEYNRTRIYDPIKVQSYDAKKEAMWKVQHKEDLLNARNRQEDCIPKSIKFAEGNTYNILTTNITNADRLMQKPDRGLNRYKGQVEKINATKQAGIDRATVEEARRINRISYDRWENTIGRGYDFVFGGPVELMPLPKPKPTIWARLHTDGTNNKPQTSAAGVRSGSFRTKDLSNLQPSHEERIQEQHSQERLLVESMSHTHSSTNNVNNTGRTRSAPLFPIESARASQRGESTRPIPPLNLSVCPLSPVTYSVPANALPGEPIVMVRTGGGLSMFE